MTKPNYLSMMSFRSQFIDISKPYDYLHYASKMVSKPCTEAQETLGQTKLHKQDQILSFNIVN